MAHRFTLVDDNTSNNAQIVEALATVTTQLFIVAKVGFLSRTSISLTRKEIQECLLRPWNTLLGVKGL